MRLQGWLGTNSCFSETADVLVTERCFYAAYKESYNELQLRAWKMTKRKPNCGFTRRAGLIKEEQ